MNKRTIGIDINPLTRSHYTGTERYLFELLTEMMKTPLEEGERVVLYASAPVFTDLPKGWEEQVLTIPFGRFWTHLRLSWELFWQAPDLFFTPAHEIPLFFRKKTKVLTTVHDIAFHEIREMYPKKERRRQEWNMRRVLKRADHILTISQATAMDLRRVYKVPVERLTVAHIAPSLPEVVEENANLKALYDVDPKAYFFTLSRVEKKKNIQTLVEAYKLYRTKTADPKPLLIGGKPGFGFEEIRSAAEGVDGIEFLGFVPDEHVIPLMKQAQAYLFPTWYEGFGMPALEAQMLGTTLLAANIPSLREVAGDGAVFIDPDDIAGWAEDMAQVEALEEAFQLKEKAVRNGQRFSWQKTAEITWEVMRKL